MSGKRTQILVAVGIVVVLAGLFALPRINNPHAPYLASLKDAGLDCMSGHAAALQHSHPRLSITVDGVAESIPANMGIVTGCMAEIHTHDATGTLHVESVSAYKVFKLEQALQALGLTLEREGYEVSLTVDGVADEALGEFILQDRQEIVLEYKSAL